MNQSLNQSQPQSGASQNLSLVAWRIRRSRAEIRETQVNRQLMERLHGVN